MTLFFISDTHFTHENIIKYCQRPFSSAEEMDEAMVSQWNARVRPNDHVYHLGDVAMRAPHLEIVRRLNGHKRLVRGNHDIFPTKKYIDVGFKEIYGLRVFDGMIFSHIPIHPVSMGRFAANVHGHIHGNPSPEGPYVNVSVEAIGYAPITLEELKLRIPVVAAGADF